jgi:acyl-CoA dehydrogenase
MRDLRMNEKTRALCGKLEAFLDECVYPAEEELRADWQAHELTKFQYPLIESLQKEARTRGLWNCFIRDERWGSGMTYLEYAPIAELTGKSWLTPRAINSAGPNSGNIELLIDYGTSEQQERWLPPLLEGAISSCYAMTEPQVASSDASNIETTIERRGDTLVVNGRKWWASLGGDPDTKLAIVMGVSNPQAGRHNRHSMVLVPMDTPGVEVVRQLSVFNYVDAAAELRFTDVEVPASNLFGQEGMGFAIAQERLAPARIHHAMRMVGMAERCIELMVKRAWERTTFGSPLAQHGSVQEAIARSKIAVDAVRLLVLEAAAEVDEFGARAAMTKISEIKVAAPSMAAEVIDRAIQLHGGAGLSSDYPFAWMYAMARTVRIADGPDEVHLRTIARALLGRGPRSASAAAPSA